ncbi:MAG: hypothetical protein AABX11_04070 [Nanoarchaeota archaeon]
MGFCLDWNIVSEIMHGDYTPEGFRAKVADENVSMYALRRYAEIVLGKMPRSEKLNLKSDVRESRLLNLMVEAISQSEMSPERKERIYEEFGDWGIKVRVTRYERRNKQYER